MTKVEFQRRQEESKKCLGWYDQLLCYPPGLVWCQTCEFWNVCSLRLYPPSRRASELVHSVSRMPPGAPSCALLGLISCPSSQMLLLIVPMVSFTCHDSVKIDKLNMSGDMWKKRLSDLLRNFLWIRVISLGLVPTLWGLISFQGTTAIYSHILDPEMSVCLCLCVDTSEYSWKLERGRWVQKENEGRS